MNRQPEPVIKIIREHPTVRLPMRATPLSAGLDLFAPESYEIPPLQSSVIPSGIRMELTKGTYGRLASKSGKSFYHNLEVGGGVVDCDYQGEIYVHLYNHGESPYILQRDDAMCQLIVEKMLRPPLQIVLEFARGSLRGTRGPIISGYSSILGIPAPPLCTEELSPVFVPPVPVPSSSPSYSKKWSSQTATEEMNSLD